VSTHGGLRAPDDLAYSRSHLTTAAISPTAAGRPSPPLAGALRQARRRLLAQRFLDWLCACVLATGALLLAAGAVSFVCGGAAFRLAWLAIAVGAALGVALLGTTAGWIDLEHTAGIVDRRAGTHDRFHTALAFIGRTPRSAFEDLTLAECLRYGENFPVRRWTPILWPRAARFLAVPALALALLCWHASLRIGEPPADPALDAAIAQRAAVLQTLADKLRRADAQGKTPDLERLAAEMKRSAERLRNASAESASDKLKGALGEISALESMLEGMKQAAAAEKASPAELAALSAALAANPQTQAAAKAVQQGQLEQAAAQLEQLLQQLEKQGNAAQAMQQLAQSMQDQTAKLTAAEKNGVAQQMQQAAQAAQAGQTALSEQALQRLAELLRKLGQNGAGQPGKSSANGAGGAAPQMTQNELQNLLNALENMKAGLGDPGKSDGTGSPQDGKADEPSLALMESFAKSPAADAEAGNVPSGLPGTAHNEGSTKNIFSDNPQATDAQRTGPAARLEGVLGDGQSLQALVGAAGDHAKASTQYRNLYNAMAPAAQDAVEQEDIPIGSRFFIGRYFDNIRP
jgi:flagellar biosynthesis GTPase FlhF